MAQDITYFRLKIYGLVQGVGFRPYIFELCQKLDIRGCVKNTGSAACIYACCGKETIGGLCSRLSYIQEGSGGLKKARVDRVEKEEISKEEFEGECDLQRGFYIEKSSSLDERIRFIPPDIGICEDCMAELSDEGNRRYRHPFISCVSCGPRFSIMESLPYDREHTSMKDFTLCEKCGREYISSGIRRHAQTIACRDCGPRLKAYIKGKDKRALPAGEDDAALELTIKYILEGKSAAVKNVGGYHFVFDALNDAPALKIRRYKDRESKPFAVMFRDLESIREYCCLSGKEEELLLSDARPIVLLEKKEGRDLAGEVCGPSSSIGAMLACDGIQALLLGCGRPLVMTSANRGGEPIESDDERALLFLEDGAVDIVLTNERKIVNPLDDSIFRVTYAGQRRIVQTIRRARGLVPEPLSLGKRTSEDLFAAGGDLKSVFAYAREDKVYLSGHFGDLEDIRAFEKRQESIKTFEKLFGFDPERYAADKHPGYISAKSLAGYKVRGVQHHHAHLLSVAAEHMLKGRVLGASFDGTGYGDDGSIWGGEFLYCDLDDPASFIREGHLMSLKFTGGDSIARDAKKAAMCFVHEAERRGLTEGMEIPFKDEAYETLSKALDNDINVHYSSSAGRLLDAACALLGICMKNTYEGECPQLLQDRAMERYKKGSEGRRTGLKAGIIRENGEYIADTVSLMADLLRLINKGEDAGDLALDLHYALADIIIETLDKLGKEKGIGQMVLGGGVFVNPLLIKMIIPSLEKSGYEVYINEKVPSGDGGLALGQIFALM